MKNRRLLWFGALLGSVLLPSTAAAEPLRLHLRGGPSVPVGGHQADEFGLGLGGTLGLELPLTPRIGVAGELGGIWLSEGDPPGDPLLMDNGSATQVSGAVAVHYRPWNTTDLAVFGPSAGWWSSASAGLALTGGLQRFVVDVAVGYDVFVDKGGTVGIGPMLAWLHVFQPDSELRPDDANIITFGIHATLDAVVREYKDTDGDGIVDVKDACPTAPEDMDGFEDEDGCPEEDNDRDGIPDRLDQCPLEPEDMDGFEDEDGCPDVDNDQDGILDAQDACPNEAETFNNYADHDGCPDAEQVRVVGDRIVLDDKVHFATNSAVIRSVSYGLLTRVAALILEHPDYIHIEVHGHADRRGDDQFNRDLSERRAQSVMNFLIEEGGLDASRLSFRGFGSEQPLMDKDTEWAWFMNRRVEFKITRDPRSAAANNRPTSASQPEAPAQDESASTPKPGSEQAQPPVLDADEADASESQAEQAEPENSDLNTEVAPW